MRRLWRAFPPAAGAWSDEIGGAVVFLASVAADYVHGVVLPVDGGWLAR
jgi:2-deoxy-D-gluconate 3-dehydrogenase